MLALILIISNNVSAFFLIKMQSAKAKFWPELKPNNDDISSAFQVWEQLKARSERRGEREIQMSLLNGDLLKRI